MLDKEIYSSKEDNVFKEIKNFPPETYFKAPEIRPTPPENSAKGGESGMTGTPSKKRKKEAQSDFNSDSNGSSGATESAGGSVGGTAVGAATAGGVSVAAAAIAATVVAVSGLIAPVPDYNVQRLEAGYDYVAYELYLEDITEDMDYFISVTHKNEKYVQELEEGFNENVIENLLPNKAYVFSIQGEASDGADTVTYYQTTVYTTNTMDEVVYSYASTFNESVTDEVEVFWDEDGFNRIVFPVYFEKQADGECLRIVAYDGNGTEYARVDCDGQTAELNVLASAVDVMIEYQKVIKLDDQEVVYETLDGGTLDFDFGITLSDAFNVVGYNRGEIAIGFRKLNGTLVSAVVVYDYGDGEIGEEITSENLSKGQYVIDVYNSGNDVCSLTAEIEMEGPYGGNPRRLVIEKEYPLEPVFEVEEITYYLEAFSGGTQNTVSFDINFWGENTAVVKVDDGTTVHEYPLSEEVSFKYEESEAKTYQYSLFDGENRLTDWVEFVVDPNNVKNENYDYGFSCPLNGSPSYVLTTYNADGTVNYYLPTRFSFEDPDVLYDVVLDGEIYYTGRDYFCAIEDMPRGERYDFRVSVYKRVGGVKYNLYEAHPSGELGESAYFGEVMLNNGDGESTITVRTTVDGCKYDYDSFVITAGGERYTVSAADFVEEDYYKVCTLTIPQVVESVTVTFYANGTAKYYDEMAERIEFKGELYTEQVMEATV